VTGFSSTWPELLAKRWQAGRDTSGVKSWAPSRRSYTQSTTSTQHWFKLVGSLTFICLPAM